MRKFTFARSRVSVSVFVVTCLAIVPIRSSAATAPGLEWVKNDGSAVIDNASGVALDQRGNVNVAGWTNGSFTGFTNSGPSDVYVAQYAPNGLRKWVKQFGSSSSDLPTAIATDVAGNNYIVGNTFGNFDGNTTQSAGDVFLMKMTSDGTELWRRQFGTAETDQAGGLALDTSGNVFVVGSTEGSVAGASNAGETDVFMAKYTSSGTQAWIKQFGSTNFDYGFGIAVDAWGTLAVVGETQGQFPGMRETGITDAFVAVFESDGTRRWLRQEDSGPDNAYNNFTSVVMDDFENIIVAGSTGGSYNGDTVVSGASDAVVMKYNKLSARLWVRQFGTTSSDAILSMSRASNGNLYVAGDTRGRMYGYLGATGAKDALVAAISASGILTWVKQYGTTQMDQFVSVDSDANGSVVVAGYTRGALTPGLVTRSEDAVMLKWSAFAPVSAPSNVLRIGRYASRATLLSLGKLTAPLGATVKLTVPTTYRLKCAVVGTSVKALRAGICRVVVSVTTQSGVTRKATVSLTIS